MVLLFSLNIYFAVACIAQFPDEQHSPQHTYQLSDDFLTFSPHYLSTITLLSTTNNFNHTTIII